MIGKTLKQLFKTANDHNNALECLNVKGDFVFIIYIDDMKFYEGKSYTQFVKLLKEEYVPDFVHEILEMLWVGTSAQSFDLHTCKHRIECYYFNCTNTF